VHKKLAIYSGSDDHTMAFLALGGEGVVSVSSNLYPEPVVRMVQAFQRGDLSGAVKLHDALYPLSRALFWEVNPIPMKAALEHKGLCEGTLRMPLTEMRGDLKEKMLALVDAFDAEFAEDLPPAKRLDHLFID